MKLTRIGHWLAYSSERGFLPAPAAVRLVRLYNAVACQLRGHDDLGWHTESKACFHCDRTLTRCEADRGRACMAIPQSPTPIKPELVA
jgi:hypothetical protein